MMKSDPKGSIPKLIINTVAPTLARKWIDRLMAHVEKVEKQISKPGEGSETNGVETETETGAGSRIGTEIKTETETGRS